MPFHVYLSPLLWGKDFMRGILAKIWIMLWTIFICLTGWWIFLFICVIPFFFVDFDLRYEGWEERSNADVELRKNKEYQGLNERLKRGGR